jgi:hypothetical protein
MSNYYYKDVNLNNIYVNDGKTTSDTNFYGYAGIPNSDSTQGSTYSGETPLPFGFTYQGTDLSTYTTANSTIYKSSGYATIPSGCKSIRVISIGGGGGGGGAGGNASAKVDVPYGNTAKGNGGAGGDGGYGSIAYSNTNINENYDIKNAVSIAVYVGMGGPAGSAGQDKSTNNNITGGKGNAGYPGNVSCINVNTKKDINNYDYVAYADQGNGGDGGNGAEAKVNNTNLNTNSSKGNAGTPGNLTYNPYDSKIYADIGAGQPGTGGYQTDSKGNPPDTTINANDGGSGAVQIIWLYD